MVSVIPKTIGDEILSTIPIFIFAGNKCEKSLIIDLYFSENE